MIAFRSFISFLDRFNTHLLSLLIYNVPNPKDTITLQTITPKQAPTPNPKKKSSVLSLICQPPVQIASTQISDYQVLPSSAFPRVHQKDIRYNMPVHSRLDACKASCLVQNLVHSSALLRHLDALNELTDNLAVDSRAVIFRKPVDSDEHWERQADSIAVLVLHGIN